jgi:hypothetical protein
MPACATIGSKMKHLADGLVTNSVIAQGLGREGNPFLRAIVGDSSFLLLKIAGALLVALLIWDIYRARPKLALVTSTVAVTLYTAIVYWNLSVLVFAQV